MKTSYFIKHLFGTLVFFLFLFLGAGSFCYWQGWMYIMLSLIMVVLNYTVLRPDADLMGERSKPGEGTKSWDKLILGGSFLFTLFLYLVAGLDSGRFHWSPDFHWSLYVVGGVLTLSGQLLFLVAQKQNKFFSSTVRIQTDREHQVCDTGLYGVVRHPAYLGSIIQMTGFPLLLGSLWSSLPAGLLVILFIVRTALEDKTLTDELNGYSEFTAKTRYRLIPFVW